MSSKAQRLPQHLLLRPVSLRPNSHADYNVLQNMCILGRQELKNWYLSIKISISLNLQREFAFLWVQLICALVAFWEFSSDLQQVEDETAHLTLVIKKAILIL